MSPVSATFHKEGLMLGWIGGRAGSERWRRCGVAAATALVVLTVTAAAQASSRDGDRTR